MTFLKKSLQRFHKLNQTISLKKLNRALRHEVHLVVDLTKLSDIIASVSGMILRLVNAKNVEGSCCGRVRENNPSLV